MHESLRSRFQHLPKLLGYEHDSPYGLSVKGPSNRANLNTLECELKRSELVSPLRPSFIMLTAILSFSSVYLAIPVISINHHYLEKDELDLLCSRD